MAEKMVRTKRNASSKKDDMCCSCNICNNKVIIPDNISTYICPLCHGSMNRNHWSSNIKCSCRSQKTKPGEEDVLNYTCLTCFYVFPDIVVDSTCATCACAALETNSMNSSILNEEGVEVSILYCFCYFIPPIY